MAYENIRLELEGAHRHPHHRPAQGAQRAQHPGAAARLEQALRSVARDRHAARAHRHRRGREGLRRRRGHRRDGEAHAATRRASSPRSGHRVLRRAGGAAHPDHRRGQRLRARRRLRARAGVRLHLRLREGEASACPRWASASSPASAARSGSPGWWARPRAKELIFTGDMIDAAKAKEIGLVLDVLPPDKLLAHCRAVAREDRARTGPLAVAQAKRVIELGADLRSARAPTSWSARPSPCSSAPRISARA